jgi:hypothetical protein
MENTQKSSVWESVAKYHVCGEFFLIVLVRKDYRFDSKMGYPLFPLNWRKSGDVLAKVRLAKILLAKFRPSSKMAEIAWKY